MLACRQNDVFADVYGECRDSERTPCVREPVGMANCGTANAEAMHLYCFHGSRSAATPIRPGPVLSARVAAICLP